MKYGMTMVGSHSVELTRTVCSRQSEHMNPASGEIKVFAQVADKAIGRGILEVAARIEHRLQISGHSATREVGGIK